MHFVGKILVVLQVVLAVLFMAFAGAVYSVQDSWRARAAELDRNHGDLNSRFQTLSASFDQYQRDKTRELQEQTDRANGFEARLRDAMLANQQLITERDTARRDADAQRANTDIHDREARERRAEAVVQRDVNKLLHDQRDELRKQIEELQKQVFDREVTIRQMVDKHTTALDELALWRRAAQAVGLKPDPQELAGQQDPPPVVYGKVLAVQESKGADHDYVEISLGEDDGLLRGHELHVYSVDGRGQYLGKIRVVHTAADRAVAIVIDKTRNGRIQRGHDVTTQL